MRERIGVTIDDTGWVQMVPDREWGRTEWEALKRGVVSALCGHVPMRLIPDPEAP